MRTLFCLCFFTFSFLSAQELQYDAPLGGPLLVTGTFGELRGNHFHAGLDFRASVNTPVYAVADGYVSRILVSPGGYGQAIYVDHPDGHRSVYGHLETLAPELLDTVRARQFAEEEFRQDLRFGPAVFPVTRGQQIGGVGNRGHSFGPHLHFEMREQAGDVALNPLAFGFSIPDTRAPAIRKLRVYELDDRGLETGSRTITPQTLRSGNYQVDDTLVVTSRRIGLALKSYDRQNAMPNWNGIFGGNLYADSTLIFEFRFARIPFEETEYLNALTDYADWMENESWFHRFWALSPQQFRAPMPKDTAGPFAFLNQARPQDAKQVESPGSYDGSLVLQPEKPINLRLQTVDFAGNTSELGLVVVYRPTSTAPAAEPHQYFLPAGEASVIDNNDMRLELSADALYRDCFFRYARLPDRSANHLSDVHQVHDYRTPLHGSGRLHLRPVGRIADDLRDHVFLGSCDDAGHLSSNGGDWTEDGRMAANISTFGDYGLFLDTVPPTVEVNYFSTDLRRATGFSIVMDDNVSGGRMNFRGTIDGKWALLEHDGKSGKLIYSFANGDPGPGEHLFELEVTDARGNGTQWQRRFRR
ncbi:M23 family metallopeptidase [Neolewinella aurantiaca]|uniref:M23 family metallopeptidase n=1 Tax=Neolewinella aurantiaca TaxID=2602767 RepID=UPI00164F61C5|nr:M23 family metallopeptidase [Neolewinella aurantiaca]